MPWLQCCGTHCLPPAGEWVVQEALRHQPAEEVASEHVW